MRFIIMHKTTAAWEAGAVPGPELIARVGALIGELQRAGVLVAGEGLRASSQGARITRTSGGAAVVRGPFSGANELPAGFSIVRAASLEDAVDWATRAAVAGGDAEVDVRPVTEPWDIGIAPMPATVTSRRYMALRKATPASEAGDAPTPGQRTALARVLEEPAGSAVHLTTERMRPSARGRRYRNTREGVAFTDGPFTESKELIAGYVIISAASLDDAGRWAERYVDAVGAHEVDVRELEDDAVSSRPPSP
jgi:hypothetical protein